jgi:hypothetical protein
MGQSVIQPRPNHCRVADLRIFAGATEPDEAMKDKAGFKE